MDFIFSLYLFYTPQIDLGLVLYFFFIFLFIFSLYFNNREVEAIDRLLEGLRINWNLLPKYASL
jgi:hypothetical protein